MAKAAVKAKAAPRKAKAETVIEAIKGFDADLKCRDYQFAVGEAVSA